MTTDTQAPTEVRRLDTPESAELARLAGVFDDLQYVLRCCEHLVTAVANPDPALVEALWTGALLGYARCFSGRTAVLTAKDLGELDLEGAVTSEADVEKIHKTLLNLRDHYASRHVNPREDYSVGVARGADGTPSGVAIVSAPRPAVDEQTVRLLGRIAYGLSALVDARMRKAQNDVLGVARDLTLDELNALPEVDLTAEEA
ncbi:hypothetical protein [Pseudonocardia phyllosphaerae]|uniref:hypothetical protein n=1 Tax=Pseudonocardia phyllosphaerae TaxID=3390502 RepID=UPI00397B801B